MREFYTETHYKPGETFIADGQQYTVVAVHYSWISCDYKLTVKPSEDRQDCRGNVNTTFELQVIYIPQNRDVAHLHTAYHGGTIATATECLFSKLIPEFLNQKNTVIGYSVKQVNR